MRFLAVLRSPAIIVSRLAVLRNCSRSTLDRLTTTYVMRHFTRLSAGGLALLHQSEPYRMRHGLSIGRGLYSLQ